jgi:type IV pilus assembly protein PilW
MTRRNAYGAAAARSRRSGGFTLVEVLVALALGVFILLALTVLFSRNTGNQNELEQSSRQLESARYSIDALAEDVMHAGYFGEFNPNRLDPAPTYTTPDPCATAANAQGWDTAAVQVQMPVPIQGLTSATAAGLGCLPNHLANTEAIVIRRADTRGAMTLAQGVVGNVYVQASRCTTQPLRIIAAAFPVANPNLTFTRQMQDCATTNDRIHRISQRSYYVASCNDCVANDGIPTLKRVELVDGQLRRVSIAEGVENLQVEYGLDTDNDGSPNNFVGIAAIDGVAPNLWQNVVSARLHVLTRGTQPKPGFADPRTYQLGAVAVAAPSDGFKRSLMTTTVRLNNVAGRRE